MKLPDVANAIVRDEMPVDYLLSAAHPLGKYKARFFAAYGFRAENWRQLDVALRQHAVDHEIAHIEQTPFGTAYAVDGALRAPDGRAPCVRVVWFVESGRDAPYFVTAYPVEKAK